MATFKVGQRVKVIADFTPLIVRAHPKWSAENCVGRTGTVVTLTAVRKSMPELSIGVHLDGDADKAWFMADELAPLTDPHADEFIADMNRFAVAAKKQVTA